MFSWLVLYDIDTYINHFHICVYFVNLCVFALNQFHRDTVYPKKYAHGFCFAVLRCGYTLTDFPIFIRLTSLALWQPNDCPSASKATLMNMDNTSCEFIMNDCITTTKQSTTKTCAYFLGYTVVQQRCVIKFNTRNLVAPSTNVNR